MRLPVAESSVHHSTTDASTHHHHASYHAPTHHHASSHTTMNCEQDFGDGGVGVTLTLRLLMHGKVTENDTEIQRDAMCPFINASVLEK